MVGRVARQHLAADDTKPLVEEALAQLKKYQAWSSTFERALKYARREAGTLPENFVWQDTFVDFWAHFTETQHELLALYDSIAEINPDVARQVEGHLDPPEKAQIEYATELTEFFTRDGYQRKEIAYDLRRLLAWHVNFESWVDSAIRGVRLALTKL
jgi:hypothetical protein